MPLVYNDLRERGCFMKKRFISVFKHAHLMGLCVFLTMLLGCASLSNRFSDSNATLEADIIIVIDGHTVLYEDHPFAEFNFVNTHEYSGQHEVLFLRAFLFEGYEFSHWSLHQKDAEAYSTERYDSFEPLKSQSHITVYAHYTSVRPRLAMPAGLNVHDHVLVWDPVAEAAGYHVKIGWQIEMVHDTQLALCDFIKEEGSHVLEVRATAEGYQNSAYASHRYHHYLPQLNMPANLRLHDHHQLTWDAVEDAEGYTIKINDDEDALHHVTTNSFDIRSVLEDVGTYHVEIKAITNCENHHDSDYSEAYTFIYER